MVWTRIFLSAPLATTSSGTADFLMRLSTGLSCTVTFKCIVPLAAADEAMALGDEPGAIPAGAEVGAGFMDSLGIVMVSPQDGHSICVPAPELSTASS